jgi:D-aminopeptidase
MDHVDEALADARDGAVEEGNVGGGTGMVCHEFKGGIGTASRVTEEAFGAWTVGVLVQAN